MKQNSLLKLMLIIPFSMTSCGEKVKVIKDLNFDEDDTKIIVVSDTHYLASSLMDPTRDYDKEFFVTDGRTMNYNNRIFDELLKTVKLEKPDYFIITGDVSYNGAYASHEELSSKLNSLNELGIKPLVIPGNHDMFIINPRDYSNKEYKIVKNTTSEEFEDIYKNCGYTGAYSYDNESSSYAYITNNNEMLLMLDTSLSRYNYEFDYNYVGGYFYNLEWLENNLKYAKENNMEVISFMHHNLINHNQMFTDKYDVGNYEELQALYHEYNVKVNFSGHLHIQNIKELNGLVDICSNSTIDYGNRYGVFKIGKEGMQYDSNYIDFTLDDGSSYHDYSFNLFKDVYYLSKKTQFVTGSDADIKHEFSSRLNSYYFDGSLYLHPELKSEKGYRLLKKQKDNKYMQSIIKDFSFNNHKYVIEF